MEEGSRIGVADGVLLRHAAVVLGPLLGSHFRQIGVLHRRHDVKGFGKEVAFLLIQFHGQLLLLAEGHLGKAETSVLRSPYQHIAQTGAQAASAVRTGILGAHSMELAIIVQLELHARIGHRIAAFIGHQHLDRSHGGIIGRNIYLREVRIPGHHFLDSVVITKDIRVHQHTAAGRGVKPTQIEHRLRLAGAQEVPFAIGPGFHPSMVVVGMRPARGVDLAGRDAYRAEGGHQESGFLTATSVSRPHCGKRRTGTSVRGLVDHLLVAPVIHFEDGICHGEILHAVFQLGIEDKARAVQLLVVNACREDEVPEKIFGHYLAPGHFLGSTQGGAQVSQVELARAISNVRQRHISVEKFQRLALIRGQLRVEHGKQVAMGQQGLFLSKVLLHLGAVGLVGNEMGITAA